MANGLFYLGPGATNNNDPNKYGLIVEELVPGSLVDVDEWEQVWNDAGSGASTDYALWRGKSTHPDYIALASIFTRSHDKPTAAETEGIKAIHRSVLGIAEADPPIWTDRGSGSKQDGSVWAVEVDEDPNLIQTGAFIATSGYGRPLGVRGVRRDMVEIA